MDTPLAVKIAQAAEFAGFGPVVAVGPFAVKAQCLDTIHEVFFRGADGSVQGHPPVLHYQNPVAPYIQGTLSLIKYVYIDTAGMPEPGSADRVIMKVSPRFHIHTRYLWLDDLEKNTALVLVELVIDNEPVWHAVGSMPYGAVMDDAFFDRVSAMLLDFQKNATRNPLTRKELDAAIAFCSKDDSEPV